MRNMFFQLTSFLLLLLIFTVFIGCSGGGNPDPVVPAEPERGTVGGSHCTWGLWQFVADPANETLDVIQLRSGNMHLNALHFLEPPPLVLLTLENLEFNGNIIEADIGLRHPFLGLTEFTGFDVCGILITNGSVTGFSDSNLRIAGDWDTRLLNPDGYARWWNPAEFPVNEGTMFSYNDGLLGTPDSHADYNCTLNGYKYFADGLGVDDTLDALPLANRGMFSAGQKNIRHYNIELGAEGLIFNYAVDASWQFPDGDSPWQAPDDFPPEANRPEAWRISVTEVENILWNDGTGSGGGLTIMVDVYDWFNAEMNTIRVDSPGNFDFVETSTPTGGGSGYSTYEVEITNATPAEGEIDILLSVVSEQEDFGGYITGTNTTAYFTHTAEVADEQYEPPCKNIPLRDDAEAVDITIDQTNGDLLVLYADKKIYRHYKEDCYQTGILFITLGIHHPEVMFAVDIAPNQYLGIALTYVSPITPGLFVYDPDGELVQYFGQAPPEQSMEAYAMTTGSYQSDLGFVRGRIQPGTGYYQTIVLRTTKVDDSYVYGAVHDYIISDGNTFGYDRIYYGYIQGVESDANGNYMWFLEDPDYYASRWELYMVGNAGHLGYDNAYFGTGSQTDNDNGWNSAKDITRDNQNNYFVLDELSTGHARVKMWTVSGDVTTSQGGFGNASTITGKALRIEGSDYDGDIVVLHGDTPPHMISVFYPSEMPGG